MTTLWQRMRETIERGEPLNYVIRNANKPPGTRRYRLRGIGYTRRERTISKRKRKMIQASRRRNR